MADGELPEPTTLLVIDVDTRVVVGQGTVWSTQSPWGTRITGLYGRYQLTIDGDTMNDQTVTVRHRDSQQQERIGIDKVSAFLAEKVGG